MHHQSKRHARLRRMIRELNRERKTQAKKVDILCHDLVEAQRSFISRLETLRFAAAFYRSLLGVSDLTQILRTASEHIGGELPQVSVSFFLKGTERGNVHFASAILNKCGSKICTSLAPAQQGTP